MVLAPATQGLCALRRGPPALGLLLPVELGESFDVHSYVGFPSDLLVDEQVGFSQRLKSFVYRLPRKPEHLSQLCGGGSAGGVQGACYDLSEDFVEVFALNLGSELSHEGRAFLQGLLALLQGVADILQGITGVLHG